MPRSTPEAELAAAEQKLDQARGRLAESRRKRRDLTTEGNGIADSVAAELYAAGREGREPDVGDQRARVDAIQAELSDLDRLENGIEAAVTDAANGVAAVRFKHAPVLEQTLLDEADKLASERADLERKLAAVAEREENVRSGWRVIAAAILGQTTDLQFDDGATVPRMRPTAPHLGISNFVPMDDWPGWFHESVRLAANEAARAPREEVTA
jgi:chromosome segregation ATPase